MNAIETGQPDAQVITAELKNEYKRLFLSYENNEDILLEWINNRRLKWINNNRYAFATLVNECDGSNTAIHYAIQNTHTELVHILIKNGVNVNSGNKYGNPSLLYAIQQQCPEIVEILINAGADLNITAINGDTPLICASKYGCTESVKLLIKNGVNVNCVNCINNTPLHYASKYGYTEIVKLLIKEGANVNCIDNKGNTPIYYASFRDYNDIVNLLIEAGVGVIYYTNKKRVMSSFDTETLLNGIIVYTRPMYKKVYSTNKNYVNYDVTKTYIITLKLPVNAECNIGYNNNTDYTTTAYRASYMYVERIECDGKLIESVFNNNQKGVRYTVGEMVYPDEYNPNPYKVCTSGIHFFMNRQSAERYQL